MNAYLAHKTDTLLSGTLVDATIIDAPSWTKNKAKARDLEMSSTKKANEWYFGMKSHVGVDAGSCIVHNLEATTAKTPDSQICDELLHRKETSVWAEEGYVHVGREATLTKDGDTFWGVMRKVPKGGELEELDGQINRIIAKVRAKVEHPFRILERQFGHVENRRYRGFAKNRAYFFTLFAFVTCSWRAGGSRDEAGPTKIGQSGSGGPNSAKIFGNGAYLAPY